jgi:hypothetical protein
MNYKAIHDRIINRARDRIYDSSIHHAHHIIPRHEDKTSTETVPLTFKEHQLIHFLRWKIVGTIGNKLAYCLLRGVNTSYTISEMRKIQSDAGKIGGKLTRERTRGIFSQDYNRSAQSKLNVQNGVAGFDACFTKEEQSRIGKRGQQYLIENKLGIHGANTEQRSIWASQNGRRGREKQRDEKLGMFARSKEHWSRDAARARANVKDLGSKRPWWTNGKENCKEWASPGPEWRNGMTRHKSLIKEIL